MKASTMRLKRLATSLLFLFLWLGIWEISALLLDLPFAIPHVVPTLSTLFFLLFEFSFWKSIFYSALRILIGLLIGVLLAVVLAILAIRLPPFHIGISQLMATIKATPVASFVMLLWILIGRDTVPIAIALLMILPIIYQSIYTGHKEMDAQLLEMLQVFQVSPIRKLKIFILPEIFRYLFPSLITATGLAWKAGIAAEIIAYTSNSIGKQISDAKNFFEGERLFAWTIAVILLSLLIEATLKFLDRRYRRYVNRNQES